jgi:hypothetical protein
MFDANSIIRRGRAYVRLIEAADELLQQKVDQHEMVTLQETRHLAVQRLRQLVRDSNPAITAQIMVASDKRLGPAINVMLN